MQTLRSGKFTILLILVFSFLDRTLQLGNWLIILSVGNAANSFVNLILISYNLFLRNLSFIYSRLIIRKAIPATDRGGLLRDVEALTFSRLTDGGEIDFMRRPRFTPQEDSWHSFLLEAKSTPGGHSADGWIY
jgi:hypothetical protein